MLGEVAWIISHGLLVIIYHVLREKKPYTDLGTDYFDKLDTARIERQPMFADSNSSATRSRLPRPIQLERAGDFEGQALSTLRQTALFLHAGPSNMYSPA